MPRPVINQGDKIDFAAMSVADLRAEALRIAGVLELCNDQRNAIFKIIDKRLAEASAAQKVVGLTPVEKDALRSVLET